MTGKEAMRRVLAYAGRWGIRLVRDRPTDLPYWALHDGGPRGSFIHFSTRTIYWAPLPSKENAISLLHELSHCLQAENPDAVNEPLSSMLAFEAYSVRWLRLPGRGLWMDRFMITTLADGRDVYPNEAWTSLSTRDRHGLLEASFALAKKERLLDASGRPTFRSF